jgi:magnesium transporter
MLSNFHSNARNRALAVLDKPKAGSWISIVTPSDEELQVLARDLNLDVDLLNDAVDIYEAPRIETDEGNVYIYTRYCYPEGKEIATEPLLIVYTHDQLITIMRTDSGVLDRLTNGKIEVLTTQKTKTLMLILGEVNRSYRLHINKVSKKTLQIRAQLRQSELSNRDFVSIIEIEEDLNEFLTALQPQATVLNVLLNGRFIRLYEDDKDMIEDLRLGAAELIELAKSRARALSNIRQAYDTIATTNLNQTFKRLTSIAIFFSIPTIIGGLWGMNVAVPMEDEKYAFSVVLLLIAVLMSTAIFIFRKKRWF